MFVRNSMLLLAMALTCVDADKHIFGPQWEIDTALGSALHQSYKTAHHLPHIILDGFFNDTMIGNCAAALEQVS